LSFFNTSYDQLKAGGSRIVFGSYDALVSDFAKGGVEYVFGTTAAPTTAVIVPPFRPTIARGSRERMMFSELFAKRRHRPAEARDGFLRKLHCGY
jgi:hypothetical protein